MRPVRLAYVLTMALAGGSCSFLPSVDRLLPSVGDDAAIRPVCAPRGADLERAFAGCRSGDVVLTAPPRVEEATILAARVCDFGHEVVVRPRDEVSDVGAMLACVYAGRVRPVPE